MHIGRLIAVAILVSGCGTGGSSTGADGGHHDGGGGSGGGSSSTSTNSTSTGNNGCDGICVAGPASGWDYPLLLWIGNDEASAPDCPATTNLSFTGHADISAPISCETCTCGAASGTSCTPSPATQPTQPALTWGTFAKGCQRQPFMPCADGQTICVPAPPPGFRVCSYHDGVKSCSVPELAHYPEQHLFYGMADDTRSCTACTCGPPSGGMCTPSGGDAMGGAMPTDAATLCCMPLP